MRDARPEFEDYVVLLKSPAQASAAFGPSTPHLRRRPSVQFDDSPRPPRHYTPSVKRGPRRTKRWIAWTTLTAVGVVVVLAMTRNRNKGANATVDDDDPSKSCEARGFLSRATNDIGSGSLRALPCVAGHRFIYLLAKKTLIIEVNRCRVELRQR